MQQGLFQALPFNVPPSGRIGLSIVFQLIKDSKWEVNVLSYEQELKLLDKGKARAGWLTA